MSQMLLLDKRKITQSNSDPITTDPIGTAKTFHERRMASFRKTVLERGGSQEELSNLTATELTHYNPLLADYTPMTR